MKFESEKSLNDYFFNLITSNSITTCEHFRYLKETSFIAQEFDIIPYGIIDTILINYELREVDSKLHITMHISVIEYKNSSLSNDSFNQINRYVNGLDHIMSLFSERSDCFNYYIDGFLIGTDINDGEWKHSAEVSNINILIIELNKSGFIELSNPYTNRDLPGVRDNTFSNIEEITLKQFERLKEKRKSSLMLSYVK
jgi:hypothetical protein